VYDQEPSSTIFASSPEHIVSDSQPKKQFGPIDRWREMSGLYKLGFDPESAKGMLFPFMAMAVPIILAIMIWKLL
jgi:hypothetical protein